MKQCKDPHWNPQYYRLSRPKQNWKFINFAGKFENNQADTHRLLKKIGAFEEFGAHGWSYDKENNNKTLSVFETNLAGHKTGSGKKMNEHYTAKVRQLVLDYYRQDYDHELFNFTKPSIESSHVKASQVKSN
jgi:hypothetical protein